ncbi:HNH endonuclease [Methylobacterium sp. Leaf125]|uniref:HNH endonuclease n=1 Tax=Methylobacterium sp. Leaf125 TaxID=1736265 RepID=UPI000B22F81F|nr:HNH endonuclease [Methylobacterium sp. Leaf125]
MDDRIARNIRNIRSLEDLAQFEINARAKRALDDEMGAAIRDRTGELGRNLIADRTGLDLTDLSPAEEKIVRAISIYAGMKKREGSNANRTIGQIERQGLLGAAEISVMSRKPTAGYEALAAADHAELTYEQIVIDHSEEFSPRALWFARNTLKLPNATDKPPARAITPVQARTEALLKWLHGRRSANGELSPHSNAQAAAALGMDEMHRHGRVFGNIQSRIDYACYVSGLPPLGLTADAPFERAWQREERSWSFPLSTMQVAAQAHRWHDKDFDAVLRETERLPGQAHLSWRKELRENEGRIREWAFGLQKGSAPTPEAEVEADAGLDTDAPTRRNPAWSRDELILALDLYLRHRTALPGKESIEVVDLSNFLCRLRQTHDLDNAATFRNANGVYMKMMNFRRFDPDYLAEGKVGLTRGNRLEEAIWEEFSNNPMQLAEAVASIRRLPYAGLLKGLSVQPDEPPYWVFVCNPKRWAIDRFIAEGIEVDTWGVRPSDRERFAPGQLGLVRVGIDRRSMAERAGASPLEAGIYALCTVESSAFASTGASDAFWGEGEAREPGWPTIRMRYLQTYLNQPLTITTLREAAPQISPLLLNGHQAASFPLAAADFHAVLKLLGGLNDAKLVSESEPDTFDKLAALEQKYLSACPEVKQGLSRKIERGPVGALIKRANGFRCQLCEALGQNPIGFKKANGEPYVEAHHVMPVSTLMVGSLAASNVMTLCANHHREVHYGDVTITVLDEVFEASIGGETVVVSRNIVPFKAA